MKSFFKQFFKRLTSLCVDEWFNVCVGAALLYLCFDALEESRITRVFPLEAQPQIGAIYSWTNHTDHQQHYLTAEAHKHLFNVTVGMFVYWFTVCLASWVRVGMPNLAEWHRLSLAPDPKRTSPTICVIMIGGAISLLLAFGLLSPPAP
jgi:hypothetical protein